MVRWMIAAMAAVMCAACGTGSTIATAAMAIGTRVVASVQTAAGEREALCAYYGAHRAEIEAVRSYYAKHWNLVPEADKPALIRINAELTACETEAAVSSDRRSRSAALLAAFKRAVSIYRELRSAGLL